MLGVFDFIWFFSCGIETICVQVSQRCRGSPAVAHLLPSWRLFDADADFYRRSRFPGQLRNPR